MTNVAKKKIIIVDDDRFLLDMYAVKFNESGFEIEPMAEGAGVLSKLKDGYVPDAILMDVVMPSMDGFELLEKIKKENLAPNAKMIILSNLGQASDIAKGKELGADGYIVKANATPSEVVKQVQEIIGI
ncbi:MAG: response regulator [Candidatus Yonathbacteria bacterium CG_4_10_14_3_um_filter_47_65]|uniref:Response regulator n=2 Tax=Parcubacteria group TaxID=1794811 RepID=A0A2M8D5Z8_9BACT|nr:MAG: hypothetical protein AUJ44_02765 [Candidatus Nomurabacteria bacterium CG1_02_47_685]PIP04013.1 MAG: response regulator [Candidatus Yonathbacteria bacterium CG23_combo_of_CG06-09_8_20_14_all_46_18]PIQ31229.1 MAG: response regulator [Candidatus Yonathbacteria bacterium CG17_big_fil_post_rev_8_21_14_2_50_46_19]PIX56255.1 MAG: response regulator [Candidatus Yonathbacteria bacterium CG_4_10_14_3_um_filter_47_65]PIY57465.1 MAG: response regulator [Candidatus Yonathbacteria bacterium CG_4_10_1